MGVLIQRIAGIVTNDIQVSGLEEFPESRWREAILFYLFGIWADRDSVTYRPKIIFGDITLRLKSAAGEYYAYGTPHEEPDLAQLRFRKEEMLYVNSGKQADVEHALIRFVKNDRIRLLTLYLPLAGGRVELWKKERRGQYGITANDIPIDWDTHGPVYPTKRRG